MSQLFNDDNISRDRLELALCLIMIIEYENIPISDLVKFTGFEFQVINSIVNNLAQLRLVEVIPTSSLPFIKLIDQDEANLYLNFLNKNLNKINSKI